MITGLNKSDKIIREFVLESAKVTSEMTMATFAVRDYEEAVWKLSIIQRIRLRINWQTGNSMVNKWFLGSIKIGRIESHSWSYIRHGTICREGKVQMGTGERIWFWVELERNDG